MGYRVARPRWRVSCSLPSPTLQYRVVVLEDIPEPHNIGDSGIKSSEDPFRLAHEPLDRPRRARQHNGHCVGSEWPLQKNGGQSPN